MNPRLYEKLYGLRVLGLIILLTLLALCAFVILNKPVANIVANRSIENTVTVQEIEVEVGSSSSTEAPVDAATPTKPMPTPTPLAEITQATATELPTSTSTSTPTPQITASETPALTSTEQATATPENVLYVCTGISNGYLNFRDAPSMSGRIIRYLEEGLQVKFIKRADTEYPWYLIEVDGVQGYAYGDFLCKK